MANDEIAHLRELLAKATPGPWVVKANPFANKYSMFVDMQSPGRFAEVVHTTDERRDLANVMNDADLIVALVNAAPLLLDIAEAARDLLASIDVASTAKQEVMRGGLRAALAALEGGHSNRPQNADDSETRQA